jgi:hypothetical protein
MITIDMSAIQTIIKLSDLLISVINLVSGTHHFQRLSFQCGAIWFFQYFQGSVISTSDRSIFRPAKQPSTFLCTSIFVPGGSQGLDLYKIHTFVERERKKIG